MPTTTDAPEGLDLRKDGTVFLHIDDPDREGKTDLVRLRRPKMRELRQFRQELWEITAEVSAFTDKLEGERREFVKVHEFDPAVPASMRDIPVEVLAEYRSIADRLAQEGTMLAESLRFPWVANVVATLSGKPVDADALPPWCGLRKFADELMEHWFQVPTRRGGT